jgi:hypothetical protein
MVSSQEKKTQSWDSKKIIYKFNFIIVFKFLLNIINIQWSWCQSSPQKKHSPQRVKTLFTNKIL